MTRLSKASKSLQPADDDQSNQWNHLRVPNRAEIKNLIEHYVNADLSGEGEWTRATEIPTEAEIGWIEDGNVTYRDFHVPISKMDGRYSSKEEYLGTQYKLMRTDGTMPLARCVDDFRRGNLDPDSNDYRVYNEVFFTSIAVARDGLALKIEFSATAIGRRVLWAKSKRLRSGSLVALTPASDKFRTKCIPAIVASRLLEELEVQPPVKPSISIYIGNPDQIDIDTQQKWTMIECTQGYWEAYRHTLKALQKVRTESFPLQQYLVGIQPHVKPPKYRLKNHFMDIDLASHGGSNKLINVNVLENWPDFQEAGAPRKDPEKISSDMDDSQIDALKRILTKEVAIVQGPPGTGKTFTSVCAIKILLDNMSEDDLPIIIAAQTNHAVDQILRHISKFDPDFVRLGGQTTDLEIIKPRTLYSLKEATKKQTSTETRRAGYERKIIGNELEIVLKSVQLGEPLTADIFFEYGLLTESQRDSIDQLESKWISDTSLNKMNVWCSNRLTVVINQDQEDICHDQLQEEHENLDEQELEERDNDDDKFEHLTGRKFQLFPGYNASNKQNWTSDEDITSLLAENQNLQTIGDEHRPAIYDFLRRRLNQKITETVRRLGHSCRHAATVAKIGRWETDYHFLRSARIIGLTTTGLSKYRGLLSLLNPKIVLIEEAAETLEPYTTAAVFDSLEHLILVGDHQQLRANCSYADLTGHPINFDISMFERLVKNNIEYSRLNRQRRMRPEIRYLIRHIYPDLVDHSSVMDRTDINGLDGNNIWFWHHENEESVDEAKSKQNIAEAKMIVEFASYLVWNSIPLGQITVLTFYNGQKKIILDNFRRHQTFTGRRVKVCTVDSYQGEENEIVLLSLVRNNDRENIGFLSSINRACVALSRARSGFYIFGNAKLLVNSDHWAKVISELQSQEAVRTYLPLSCSIHDTMLDARTFTDLEGLCGGCGLDCQKKLDCGHPCPLKCHPGRGCSSEDCEQPCPLTLECGHPCTADCAAPCECGLCVDALWISADPCLPVRLPHLPKSEQHDHDKGSKKRYIHQQSPKGQDAACFQVQSAMPTPTEAAQIMQWTEFARSESKLSASKLKVDSKSGTLKKYPHQHDPPVPVGVPNNDVRELKGHAGKTSYQLQRQDEESKLKINDKSLGDGKPVAQILVDIT